MGGELRPELQAKIFDGASYPAGTPFKQDFGIKLMTLLIPF